MIYTVLHFHRSGMPYEETCRGTFATAKAMAKAAVDERRAERVEVRDVSGKLVFHHSGWVRA